MTRFKICGLRDSASAMAAAKSGADLLGFVFVEGVRRQLLPEIGLAVISEFRDSMDGGGPAIVGLFANQPAEFVNRVARLCALDYAQLCGGEPPEMWERLEVPIIRQVKVREDLPRACALDMMNRQVEEALRAGHHVALDKHEAGRLGGTGSTFDWNLALGVASRNRALLAGGLTPDNVGDAIRVARPWGVDVSSGVETGGVKDAAKIRAFAEAVRSADRLSGKERRD